MSSVTASLVSDTEVVLIPVVGGLEYKTDGRSGFLESGQVGCFSLSAGMSYTVSNPYEQETINLLHLWLTHFLTPIRPGFARNSFDLATKNTLLSLLTAAGHRGFIGQYDGRAEGIFRVGDPAKGVFVFVLQGVFEVANRLLHANDGLALRDLEEVEFEALSNEAILVLVVV